MNYTHQLALIFSTDFFFFFNKPGGCHTVQCCCSQAQLRSKGLTVPWFWVC